MKQNTQEMGRNRYRLIEELQRTGQGHLADQVNDEDLLNHLNKMGHADLADRIREANELFDQCIGKRNEK